MAIIADSREKRIAELLLERTRYAERANAAEARVAELEERQIELYGALNILSKADHPPAEYLPPTTCFECAQSRQRLTESPWRSLPLLGRLIKRSTFLVNKSTWPRLLAGRKDEP
jgi:hypothetical protein